MSEKRMFEFVQDGSSKFWEIWRDGVEVHTRYGRIGSSGQTTVKRERDEAKAEKLHDALVKEKTGKGYVESTAGSAAAPAAPAAKKAPTKAAPPGATKLTGLLPWMATGMGYRSADFDADDVYLVNCSIDGDGNLAVSFGGTAGDGAFVCSAAAIEHGVEKIHVAQGGATFSQTVTLVDEEKPNDAFPPFLLSRSLFATLKAGKPIAWPTVLSGDGKTVQVKKKGTGTKAITVNGKKQTVKTVVAEGDSGNGAITLVLLDDAAWPLILVNHEADECGWWLKQVGKDLDADAIADMTDDEEEDEQEDEESAGEDGGWRRFEMEEKFWAIKLDGTSHTVKYGKQGTNGQEKTKSFDDEDDAKKDYDRLVKEKTGKGYEEVDGTD